MSDKAHKGDILHVRGIPAGVMKGLKVEAVSRGITLREVVIEALEPFRPTGSEEALLREYGEEAKKVTGIQEEPLPTFPVGREVDLTPAFRHTTPEYAVKGSCKHGARLGYCKKGCK